MVFDVTFISALVAIFLVAASPGPAVLAIIATSMEQGRAKGLAITGGILTGTAIWGAVSFLGLISILQSYDFALIGVKILGGLYLLYLALTAFRKSLSDETTQTLAVQESGSLSGRYLSGLFLHLTNPKALLAWIAPMSIAVNSETTNTYALVLTFFCIGVVGAVKLTFAIFFSIPIVARAYFRARKNIQRTFSLFFTFSGVRMFLSVGV